MVHKRHLGLRAPTVLAVGFALTILVGALVLMLPVSAADGQDNAVSRRAVYSSLGELCYRTRHGQHGGALVGIRQVRHPAADSDRRTRLYVRRGYCVVCPAANDHAARAMVMSAGLNLSDGGGIVRLTRRVLFGTFIIEGTGAVLLSCRFVPHYGFPKGITMGVFHAVSAFCNAGFDLMGTPDDPFQSLIGWGGGSAREHYADGAHRARRSRLFRGGATWDKHSFCRLRLHNENRADGHGRSAAVRLWLTLLFEWEQSGNARCVWILRTSCLRRRLSP